MGHSRVGGTGLLLGDRQRKPGHSRRQWSGTIGRAREQQHAVFGVVAAATGRIVVSPATRFIAPAVKAHGIQHGETDSHPGEQQNGEKTKDSGRQGEPVPHGEHYHWYGASKSMFPRQVGAAIEPG